MCERAASLLGMLRRLIVAALLVQLTGCGTILYPERRNQAAGRLDPAVVVLDGIGLLFFFVPGVIAFAVDFATGAIYLPSGRSRRVGDLPPTVRRVPFDPARHEGAALAGLIEAETGLELDLARGRVWALGDEERAHVEQRVLTANLAIARSSHLAR